MSIVASASLSGFFREAVEGAIRNKRVEATAGATQYIVSLLADYARPDARAGETLDRPLTFLLNEALTTHDPLEKFERLKILGDGVLYSSGFFGDHFEARGVDAGYVLGIGRTAYNTASGMLHGGDGPQSVDIFGELAEKFTSFVDVVGEVANLTVASSAATSRGVLKMYERWLKTGSASLAKALGEQGFVPTRGSGKGLLQ